MRLKKSNRSKSKNDIIQALESVGIYSKIVMITESTAFVIYYIDLHIILSLII